ncbi:MAG: hypothetical protein JKY37_15165 [Nannocystaceae bacterium]|nr:hypothetical protein [Nannocystaceae bacterium]
MIRAVATATLLAAIPTWAYAGEPDATGPFDVQTEGYDFGDEAFGPPGFGAATEMRAEVYSPTDLASGPFPLVVMMHGRHATCYNPDSPGGTLGDGSSGGGFGEWPCAPGHIPIPSYEGYAFAATTLASHGYIVVSVSADGINAADNNTLDGGADARGYLIVAHLTQWAEFATAGAEPFGDKYVGAVDLERIGVVGHSRGGEGAARAVLIDQANDGIIGIDAALLLAPVDFTRPTLSDVALGIVLPYCDGDVTDLQGAHYFDDARYAAPGDLTPKYIFTMYGMNHNFFNTVWSPSSFVAAAGDDFQNLTEIFESSDPDCSPGPGSSRLTESQQQGALVAYMAAFFRRHLGEEEEFDDVLRGNVTPAAARGPIFTTYQAPDDPTERLDVNALDDDVALQTNTLGETVTADGLKVYDLCGLEDANAIIDHCVDELGSIQGMVFDSRQPHTPGLGQLRIAFGPDARWTNTLPAGTDVSALQFVQLRAGVDFEGPGQAASAVEARLELTDTAGVSASVALSDYTDALQPAPGTLTPFLPKKILHGIRVPLVDFEGIDLSDLASVAVVFDGAPRGLLLSDLAFSDAVIENDPSGTGTGGDTGADSGGAVDGSTGGDGDGDGNGADDLDATSGGAADGTGTADGTDTGDPGQGDGDDVGCACGQGGPRGGGTGLLVVFVLLASRRRGDSVRPRNR